MFVLVSKRDRLYEIKQKLTFGEYQCSIETMFVNYNFNSAKHTSTLYHNASRREILNKLNDFRARKHPPLIIAIMKYIQMKGRTWMNRPSPEEFRRIMAWLRPEFPS